MTNSGWVLAAQKPANVAGQTTSGLGCRARAERACNERRLARRLEDPPGCPEGRAGPLEREGAETMSAEVTILAGWLFAHGLRVVPRR